MSVTTAVDLFVVTHVANMGATTTSVEVSHQMEAPQTQSLAYDYDAGIVQLNANDSVKLLNAFTFAGGVHNGSTISPVTCSGINATFLAEVLRDNLPNAANLAGAEASLEGDLDADLEANAKADANIIAALLANNVINAVETAGILSFQNADVVLDTSGGAAAMGSGLTTTHAMQIYRQLPQATLEGGADQVYIDASDDRAVDSLPMLKGQTLVFGFNVSLGTVTFTGSGSSTSGPITYSTTSSGTTVYNSGVDNKKVIFRVKLVNGTGPFTVSNRRFVAA